MQDFLFRNCTKQRTGHEPKINPFTSTRYPARLKKIQLAFCNPYGGVKTISKESFSNVI